MVTNVVTVTKLRIRLVKVTHPSGWQLVLGGRLLLEERDGVRTPHPDLPPYVPGTFPVPYAQWSDEETPVEGDPVTVAIVKPRTGKTHVVGSVRAHTLLFTPMPADEARQWLRSQMQEKGGGR